MNFWKKIDSHLYAKKINDRSMNECKNQRNLFIIVMMIEMK